MDGAAPKKPDVNPPNHDKSFAQVLQNSCEVLVSQLPLPAIKGDSLYIKITQSEYEKGLIDCKRNLHGRLMLSKGDKPVTAKDLKAKLTQLWKPACPWHLVSLGRGFYEFQFTSYEDMRLAWSMGTINLKPGILRLSKWTNDFNTYAPRQTHAQIWVRLMELPQEYWRQRTLFEIASAVGTPLTLDEATNHRAFGHYARVLVDIDLSRRLFDEITVRDGYEFKLEVVYERLPAFCLHCITIGHDLSSCRWLLPAKEILKQEPVKKPLHKPQTQYVPKSKNDDAGLHKHLHVDEATSKAPRVVPEQEKTVPTAAQVEVEPEANQMINTSATIDAGTKSSTSFHMALDNVRDEVVCGDIDTSNVVLQVIDTDVGFMQKQIVGSPLEAPASVSYCAIPETQLDVVITKDDEFDEVAKQDNALVRQTWADMVEKEAPFTTYISPSQRKKMKQKDKHIRSAGQPYHTRSKGVPDNRSL
jgi:hypothetical protein